MILFKILIPLILSSPGCCASSSEFSLAPSTVSVLGYLRRASSQVSSYASILESYESVSSGYICLRCLDLYMSMAVSHLYYIPRYVDSYTLDDMDTLMPVFYSMTEAIGYALNKLVDVSDSIGAGSYSGIVRGQVEMLGLAHSAGISSLWESIETNLPCSSALEVSKRLDDLGSYFELAASAYSGDPVSFVPGSNTCFTKTNTANATATAQTVGLYAGVVSAASEASKNAAVSTTSGVGMMSSTSSVLGALSAAVRSAKNAALAHPSLVGSRDNLEGYKEAIQGIVEVFRLIYQNSTSYKQYDYNYRRLTLELAAMLYAQLEKADGLPCSDYRSVASQFISLTSARYAVSTKVFSSDMAAFPTVRPPYSQSCLYTAFASPTVAWASSVASTSTSKHSAGSTGFNNRALYAIIFGAIVGTFILVVLSVYVCCVLPKRMRIRAPYKYRGTHDSSTLPSRQMFARGPLGSTHPVVPRFPTNSPEPQLATNGITEGILLLGTCAQCGSDVLSNTENVTCCQQVFHATCMSEETPCLGRSSSCIGRPELPQYEKPPAYNETTP